MISYFEFFFFLAEYVLSIGDRTISTMTTIVGRKRNQHPAYSSRLKKSKHGKGRVVVVVVNQTKLITVSDHVEWVAIYAVDGIVYFLLNHCTMPSWPVLFTPHWWSQGFGLRGRGCLLRLARGWNHLSTKIAFFTQNEQSIVTLKAELHHSLTRMTNYKDRYWVMSSKVIAMFASNRPLYYSKTNVQTYSKVKDQLFNGYP